MLKTPRGRTQVDSRCWVIGCSLSNSFILLFENCQNKMLEKVSHRKGVIHFTASFRTAQGTGDSERKCTPCWQVASCPTGALPSLVLQCWNGVDSWLRFTNFLPSVEDFKLQVRNKA